MGADDHCYWPRTPMVLERVRDKTAEALAEAHRTNLLRIMIADPARIDALAIAIQDWNASHARLDSPALIAQGPLAYELPDAFNAKLAELLRGSARAG